jgi:hypothetical protein
LKLDDPPLIRKAGRNLEYKSSPLLKLRASKLFDGEPCKYAEFFKGPGNPEQSNEMMWIETYITM